MENILLLFQKSQNILIDLFSFSDEGIPQRETQDSHVRLIKYSLAQLLSLTLAVEANKQKKKVEVGGGEKLGELLIHPTIQSDWN